MENLIDSVRRSTDLQNNIIEQLCAKAVANYTTAYNKINQIVDRYGLKNSNVTNQVITGIGDIGRKVDTLATNYHTSTESIVSDIRTHKTKLEELGSAYSDLATTIANLGTTYEKSAKNAQSFAKAHEVANNIDTTKITDQNDAGGQAAKNVEKVVTDVGNVDKDGNITGGYANAGQDKEQNDKKVETANKERNDDNKAIPKTTQGNDSNQGKVNNGTNYTPTPTPTPTPTTTTKKVEKSILEQAKDFINSKKTKAKYSQLYYSDLNRLIYQMTGGYILSDANMKALSKLIGATHSEKMDGGTVRKLANIGYLTPFGVVQLSGPLSSSNIAQLVLKSFASVKSDMQNFVKTKATKAKNKKNTYSDVNQKIYDKTGGKILVENDNTHRLKEFAEYLGIKYDNAKSSGNLYKKLKEYGYFAKGSRYITKDQLGWTQDKGQELVYRRADGSILTPLGKGDKVFTAEMTDSLWQLAKGLTTDRLQQSTLDNAKIVNIKPVINMNDMDNSIIIQGNADETTVEQIRGIMDDRLNKFTKQLTEDFSMFGHKMKF